MIVEDYKVLNCLIVRFFGGLNFINSEFGDFLNRFVFVIRKEEVN